jgi:hypothetical protein
VDAADGGTSAPGSTRGGETSTSAALRSSDGLVVFAARPNPFRHEVTIEYALPEAGPVELVIHDAAGRAVRRLVSRSRPAGAHSERWNGRNDQGGRVASGVYFVRLNTGSETKLRKLIMVR